MKKISLKNILKKTFNKNTSKKKVKVLKKKKITKKKKTLKNTKKIKKKKKI